MSYFSPIFRDSHTVIPGVGTIHSHTVGSTAHTTGHDHYFLAEGEEKPVAGSVRFSAYVAEDGTIQWRFVHAEGPNARKRGWKEERLTEGTQVDFPAEVVVRMRQLSEALHERPDNAWFFSALGAVEMELEKRRAEQADLERAIASYTKFLADPAEPRHTFVSAKEAGTEKGYNRPATKEETAERRADWIARRERANVKLAELHAAQDVRVEMLTRLRKALRDWSGTKAARPRPSAYEVYQAAIAA